MAGGGLRYETGRDMPPGMQEKVAVKIVQQFNTKNPEEILAPTVNSRVFNMDCMEGMKQYTDGYFDLAIVDPVYGDVRKGGYMKGLGGGRVAQRDYDNTCWDQPKTGKDYFTELFRVSKNQVIWGGNYFTEQICKNSTCWLIWDKCHPSGICYADCELAWTSFDGATRLFRYMWNGMNQGKSMTEGHIMQGNKKKNEVRRHPMQKPANLYRWIYEILDIPAGSKILDTHVGSGTHRIAAFDYGMDFTGYEIVKKYFEDQEIAFAQYTAQTRMEGY